MYRSFPNLADDRECDKVLKLELEEAKINVFYIPQSRSEVPFQYVGVINS